MKFQKRLRQGYECMESEFKHAIEVANGHRGGLLSSPFCSLSHRAQLQVTGPLVVALVQLCHFRNLLRAVTA